MEPGAHHQCNGKVLRNIIRSSAQAANYLINGGVQFVYAFAGTTEEDIMRAHSPLPMAAALSSGARVREQGFEHSSTPIRTVGHFVLAPPFCERTCHIRISPSTRPNRKFRAQPKEPATSIKQPGQPKRP